MPIPAIGSAAEKTVSSQGRQGKLVLPLAAHSPTKRAEKDLTRSTLRVPRLFDELAHARADGSYTRRLNAIARCELLMLDDWGIAPFKDEQRRDIKFSGLMIDTPPLHSCRRAGSDR